MLALLSIIHVVVCVFLIIVVLLQSGKSADIAGTFGGVGSQTAFGPRGAATLLSKATTTAAIMFMITALSLSILSSRRSAAVGSVLGKETAPKQATPANPTPIAPATNPANNAATPATSGGASQNAQDAPKPKR